MCDVNYTETLLAQSRNGKTRGQAIGHKLSSSRNISLYPVTARWSLEWARFQDWRFFEKNRNISLYPCTRTDNVTRKMEYKDSSILNIVLNIDSSQIQIEHSDGSTWVVGFVRKMTGTHWSMNLCRCIWAQRRTKFFVCYDSEAVLWQKNEQPNDMKDWMVSRSLQHKALSMCLEQ